MRLLILGGTGMLGFQMIKECMKQNVDFYVALRNPSKLPTECQKKISEHLYLLNDVSNWVELEKCILMTKPDYVINCVGIVKQSPLAVKHVDSITINSLLPHKLENYGKKYGYRLIHISTDCVFSGKEGNYLEDDFPDADDLYGRSKFLGEVDYGCGITLRTSIIGHEIGSPTNGLLEWFLSAQGKVHGYKNAIFSGLTTNELSRVILDHVIPSDISSGVYHISSKAISKYDLLKLISKVYGVQTEIIPNHNFSINRSLDSSRFTQITSYQCPDWKDIVNDMYIDYFLH